MPTAVRSDGGWRAVLAAAVALAAAAPPAAFPGAEFLVVPGLAALARAVSGRGGFLRGYVAGALYLAWVSWSIGHVVFAAYIALFVVGGLYTAVLAPAVRGLAALRVPMPFAFACACTASCWLRAHMIDVPYPHAQPAHSLYPYPGLLGAVAWVGEVGLNFALALLGASLASRPNSRGAWLGLGVGFAVWFVPGRPQPDATVPVDVVAVQPGLDADAMFERDPRRRLERAWKVLAEPTLAAAGPDAPRPPDLVLWPESTGFVDLTLAEGRPRLVVAPLAPTERPLRLHRAAHLLVGSQMHAAERAGTPIAVLLDAEGRYLGHHEKLRLAPGGERQPFLGWLPETWNVAFREAMGRALGIMPPHLDAGGFRPPLPLRDGVRLGALLCFDNAFDDVVRQHVEAGANLLVVLSNEAWYRRGAELAQMEAMTVFRALETGVPLVRATMDGATLAVGGDGRVTGRLPVGPPGQLRIVAAAPRAPGPVAPGQPWLAWGSLGAFAIGVAHAAWVWARLGRTGPGLPGSDPTAKLPVASA